jgi:hypothetical protein
MWVSAKYVNLPLGGTTITAVKDDGSVWYVPEDPANTDYQNIMALVAEGKLVIQPAD